MKRVDTILRSIITGLVCLGLLLYPVFAEAAVVFMNKVIPVVITKEVDPTIPFEYIEPPADGEDYLKKPVVPEDGIPDGQQSPLPGETWIPLGIGISIGGKTIEQIKQETAKLADYPGSTIVVEICWRDIEAAADEVYNLNVIVNLLRELKKLKLNAFIVVNFDEVPVWIPANWRSCHPAGPEINPQTGAIVKEHTGPWVSARAEYTHYYIKYQVLEFIDKIVGSFAAGGDYADVSSVIASWVFDLGEGYIDSAYKTYIGYGQTCVSAFRIWLKNKYTDIATLNNYWGTSYLGFFQAELPVPYEKDTVSGKYKYVVRDKAAWYDLVQWREEVLAGWAKDVVEKAIAADTKDLKEGANNHLFSVLVPGAEPGDSDWQYSAVDPAKIATACKDAQGKSTLDFWSINCIIDNKQNESVQWQLARTWNLTGLPVMVLQLAADSNLSASLRRRLLATNMWQLLNAGALGIQLGKGQGTIDETSAEYLAVSDVATVIQSLKIGVVDAQGTVSEQTFSQYLTKSIYPVAEAGFLITDAQDTIFNRAEAEMSMLYQGLKKIGVQPGFISEGAYVNGTYNPKSKYRTLILARDQKMSNAVFTALKAETLNLHANADLPALMDEYGKPRHLPQGAGAVWDDWRTTIDYLFGVDGNNSIVDADLEDMIYTDGYESPSTEVKSLATDISCLSLSYDGQADLWKYRNQLAAASGSSGAKFKNGNPALVTKANKAAITLFALGDSSGAAWDWHNRCQWLGLIYKNNISGFGVKPEIDIQGDLSTVWLDYRKGPNSSVLVYLYNYSETKSSTLELQSGLFANMQQSLLLTGTKLSDRNASGIIKDLVIGPQQQVFIFSTLPQEQEKDDDQKKDDNDKQKKDESTDESKDEDYYLKQLPIDEDFIYDGDGPIIHDGSTTNVLPMLVQATDGSGNVLITYSILDGQQDKCSVTSIQYQLLAGSSQSANNANWQDLQEGSLTGNLRELGSRVDIKGSVHTLAWTNYKECVTDTVLSDVRVRLKVSDGSRESQYAVSPAFNIAAKWYLAEGCPDGFDEWILITNPNPAPVYVRATFVRPDGTTIERDDLTIWGNSRYTLHINDFISDQPVSAIIESTDGQGIVVERAMYWDVDGISWAGGHVNLGVTVPSTKWYFAEGRVEKSLIGAADDYQDNIDFWFLILNPNNEIAELTIKLVGESGTVAKKEVSVPAMSRYSLDLGDSIISAVVAAEVTVENQVPVVVERSMYWNSGNEKWIGGHCSSGVTAPGRTWYFAEGCTAERGAYIGEKSFELNFSEWLLLYNPGTQTADVTMTFYKEDGSTLQRGITLAGNQRSTVEVNGIIYNSSSSVKLESTEGLIAERSMYWDVNGIKWGAGHSSSGVTTPGKVWYLAEGATAESFEQWILILNPQSEDAAVTLEFIDTYGLTTEERITVPAKSRRSIYVADIIPEDVISARIEADQDIVVERAMYWDSGEYRWVGGHSSKAFR